MQCHMYILLACDIWDAYLYNAGNIIAREVCSPAKKATKHNYTVGFGVYVCVKERQIECACVCGGERERGSVCVCERERV